MERKEDRPKEGNNNVSCNQMFGSLLHIYTRVGLKNVDYSYSDLTCKFVGFYEQPSNIYILLQLFTFQFRHFRYCLSVQKFERVQGFVVKYSAHLSQNLKKYNFVADKSPNLIKKTHIHISPLNTRENSSTPFYSTSPDLIVV